jgi:hypothetical protein
MMDKTKFWGEAEGENPRGVRGEHRHHKALAVLSIGRNVCFGKDDSPQPAPDPLIGQAAQGNVQLGQDALNFSKQQYEDSKVRQAATDALTNKVAQSALDSQDLANKWAQDDRDTQTAYRTKYDNWADQDRQTGQDTLSKDQKLASDALASGQKYEGQFGQIAAMQNGIGASQTARYGQNFAPVENQVASDAMNWDSAGRQEAMAGEAKADAIAAGTQARDAAGRQMMSMGVNPNSGKFAATSQANDTAVALAGAGAQNAARDNVRMQGVQLRQQAAQLGQQVLASGQQANSLGMQATGAAQTAYGTGVSTAMQAQQQGLAAAGVGNTTASLGLGQQGAGYAGLGTGLSAGGAATGANAAGNQYNMQSNNAMMNGFQTAGGLNSSGAGIANAAYGNQLNAWGQQQQANGQLMSGIGSMVGTGAALFL